MNGNQQKSQVIEIDLRSIFSILFKEKWIIILIGLISALLAVGATKLFITPMYQSTTKIYVLSKQTKNVITNGDLETSTLLTQDYIEIIKSRTVLEDTIEQLNLDMEYEDLLEKIEITSTDDTRVITISVINESPYMARNIADVIRKKSADHIQKVMDIESVNIVERANLPENECSPNLKKNGLVVGLLGCLITIFFLLTRYVMNDTIKISEDVERYLQLGTLGVLPLANVGKQERRKKSWVKSL